MKKKLQNRKGFTLIELLVAIVILGIIVVMSIPQISNLIDSNSDRKFEVYEETIRTSGKLYTDSYNQDMFGNNTSGCYDIEYSKMVDKKLIKDVNINNATCDGGSQKKTFVRVYKSGDIYRYKVSILCTDKNNRSTVLYSNTIDGDIAGEAAASTCQHLHTYKADPPDLAGCLHPLGKLGPSLSIRLCLLIFLLE